MREIRKGDYVYAKQSGHFEGRNTRDWFARGEELKVTAVYKYGVLGVRSAIERGPAVYIKVSEVNQPARQVGEMPSDGIAADDPRIQWIFEDAGRLADRYGYCAIYDKIAKELGVAGRERTFSIKLANADGVVVTARVLARSRKLAEQRLREQFAGNPLKAIEA